MTSQTLKKCHLFFITSNLVLNYLLEMISGPECASGIANDDSSILFIYGTF